MLFQLILLKYQYLIFMLSLALRIFSFGAMIEQSLWNEWRPLDTISASEESSRDTVARYSNCACKQRASFVAT